MTDQLADTEVHRRDLSNDVETVDLINRARDLQQRKPRPATPGAPLRVAYAEPIEPAAPFSPVAIRLDEHGCRRPEAGHRARHRLTWRKRLGYLLIGEKR